MNLREIHAHVEITRQDAEDWLAVMDRAMQETAVPETQRQQIMGAFRTAALSLVNAAA
jgi:hemoglobin